MHLHAADVCYPADSKLFLKEEKAKCLAKFDAAIYTPAKKNTICVLRQELSVSLYNANGYIIAAGLYEY